MDQTVDSVKVTVDSATSTISSLNDTLSVVNGYFKELNTTVKTVNNVSMTVEAVRAACERIVLKAIDKWSKEYQQFKSMVLSMLEKLDNKTKNNSSVIETEGKEEK